MTTTQDIDWAAEAANDSEAAYEAELAAIERPRRTYTVTILRDDNSTYTVTIPAAFPEQAAADVAETIDPTDQVMDVEEAL